MGSEEYGIISQIFNKTLTDLIVFYMTITHLECLMTIGQ